MHGEYGSELFEYVSLKIKGCELDPELCAPDDEVAKLKVNLIFADTLPNILLESSNSDDYVESTLDLRKFFQLNPTLEQKENLFFTVSQMRIKDNYWDFFELSEYVIQFFEKT